MSGGKRSIRYYREVAGVRAILANDLSAAAAAAIRANIVHNHCEAGITANLGDASAVMYNTRPMAANVPSETRSAADTPATQFNIIDLDPYGSAIPFIDAAIQSIADGNPQSQQNKGHPRADVCLIFPHFCCGCR